VLKLSSLLGIPLIIVSSISSATTLTSWDIQPKQGIKNKTLESGSVKVVIDSTPNKESQFQTDFDYKIYHQDRLYLQEKDSTYLAPAKVNLVDLDKDGTAEVIVSTFSGGAHCCTSFNIYSWQKDKFTKTATGNLDGEGGSFVDLNKDGKYEFITYDNSFLYTFSSYAGSYPPTLIYSFEGGKFQDITHKYPQKMREVLNGMYNSLRESQKNKGEINGILAGYVAQKILLGEYEQAWQFMLKNYDKSSDWGLDIYKGDRVVGKYADFPTALRAFLIQQGYLKADGKPPK
jgi:hypothetical protein